MPLVSMRQLLDHAAEHGYGIPAFNVNNLEQVQAVMAAADEVGAPVILQASAGARKYAGEPFICVAPVDLDGNTDGGFFNVEASNDTNRVDLFVFGNDERMLLVARLDNLGKGASGAAVQAMNVHLGVEESLGLV